MSTEIVIRPAQLSDAEGIAKVHTRSWQAVYRGLLPDDLLDGLLWQDRKTRWETILANPTAPTVYVATNSQFEIVGFASAGISRDEDAPEEKVYELYAIYLSPEVWRSGIGGRLLHAVMRGLPNNFNTVSLWVLKENLIGRAFYESQGFVQDGGTKIAHLLGHQREEIRYRIHLPIA